LVDRPIGAFFWGVRGDDQVAREQVKISLLKKKLEERKKI